MYTVEVEDGEWNHGYYENYATHYNIDDFSIYLVKRTEDKVIVIKNGPGRGSNYWDNDDHIHADFTFHSVEDCVIHFLKEYDKTR